MGNTGCRDKLSLLLQQMRKIQIRFKEELAKSALTQSLIYENRLVLEHEKRRLELRTLTQLERKLNRLSVLSLCLFYRYLITKYPPIFLKDKFLIEGFEFEKELLQRTAINVLGGFTLEDIKKAIKIYKNV